MVTPPAAPEISIVMPTRNRGLLVVRQIDAVRNQNTGHTWELIVVDNGSTDNTQSIIERYAELDPRVKLVVATERAHAAYARNVGAKAAVAPLLAFIDDDDVVGTGWLAAMFSALANHRLVASAMEYDLLNSPAVLDGWPKSQRTTLVEVNGLPVCNAAVGVQRSLWDQLGGQREGHLGEDAEMAYRAVRDFGVVPHLALDAIYHRQLPERPRGAFKQGVREGRGAVRWVLEDSARRTMSAAERRGALRSYWWLLSRSPLALIGRRRHLWMLALGNRVGRLAESFQTRSLLL